MRTYVNGLDRLTCVDEKLVFSWYLLDDYAPRQLHKTRISVTEVDRDTGRPNMVWSDEEPIEVGRHEIIYRGPELRKNSLFEYRIEVERDDAILESGGGKFCSGPVNVEDWEGEWVSGDYDADDIVHYSLGHATYATNKLWPVCSYSKSVWLDSRPLEGLVHIAAKGIFRLWVNGISVGGFELAPGWVDYRYRIPYQSFEVQEYFHLGHNEVTLELADGWWCGFVGTDRGSQARHYGDHPELLVEGVLYCEGGQRVALISDASWSCRVTEALYADLMMGQYIDHTKASHTIAGVDAGAPLAASDMDLPIVCRKVTSQTELYADLAPFITCVSRLSPIDVTHAADGSYIIDFGQNCVGHIKLRLHNQRAGSAVIITHAEACSADDIYIDNLRTAEARDVYIASGDPNEMFEPYFTLHGFRYVKISGLSTVLAPSDIQAIVVSSNLMQSGEVESGHVLLNRLQHNILWSLRGNFIGFPTDCPQRDERLGWLADAQIFCTTACWNVKSLEFYSNWLTDVRLGQRTDGAFVDTAPAMVHKRSAAPGWGDAGTIVPWELYKFYKNRSHLEQSLRSMRSWVDYVTRWNPNLLWEHHRGNDYGDWLNADDPTPSVLVATAYFAHSADITARAARILDEKEVASSYEELFEQIKDRYVTEFFSQSKGLLPRSQTAHVLSLAFGLIPSGSEVLVANGLAANIRSSGESIKTGFLGVGSLCKVLSSNGLSELAWTLLLREDYPSWLFPVVNGATTVWERWDGWTPWNGFQSPRMNSFNHYAFGAVGSWLYSGAAGIDQTESSAGFEDLVITPCPDSRVKYLSVSFDSVRGRIGVKWDCSPDGSVDYVVTVPPGRPATLKLPRYATGASDHSVVHREHWPELVGDSNLVREAGELYEYQVDPGTHYFTSGKRSI